MSDGGPIVIGGTGGSGTRAVRAVLEAAGAFMGAQVNKAGDALAFEPFLDGSVNAILSAVHGLNYRPDALPQALRQRLDADFAAAVAAYRADRPENPHWGWKNPRSIYILPLIHAHFPEMRFLHVVRDGRDMALSENQNQLRKHYEALFEASPADLPPHLASLRLWARVNGDAADWAEARLGARYLRMNIEDLVASPRDASAKILGFAGMGQKQLEVAASVVDTSTRLGRWRDQSAAVRDALSGAENKALARLGYAAS